MNFATSINSDPFFTIPTKINRAKNVIKSFSTFTDLVPYRTPEQSKHVLTQSLLRIKIKSTENEDYSWSNGFGQIAEIDLRDFEIKEDDDLSYTSGTSTNSFGSLEKNGLEKLSKKTEVIEIDEIISGNDFIIKNDNEMEMEEDDEIDNSFKDSGTSFDTIGKKILFDKRESLSPQKRSSVTSTHSNRSTKSDHVTKSRKKYLILYFYIPIEKSITPYGIFDLSKSEIVIPKHTNEKDSHSLIIKDITFMEDLSCSHIKKSDITIEEFFTLQFFSQSSFSIWKFYFQMNSQREKTKLIHKRKIKKKEIVNKVILNNIKSSNSKKTRSFSTCGIGSSRAQWKEKKYIKWSGQDVLQWLSCIFYTKQKSFLEVVGNQFREHEVNGELLSEITDKQELKKLGVGVWEVKRLYDELLHLRLRNGYFDDARFQVLYKYCNLSKNDDRSYGIDELKSKYAYTFDIEILKKKITCILFDIDPYINGIPTDVNLELEKIIRNTKAEYFRFYVKILAVIPNEEPKFFEKLGMKFVSKKFDTFFHLGLLIKNLQLDWYNNSLVYIRSTESKKPLLCADVDSLLIYKQDIRIWIDQFANEIIRWNREMKYIPFAFKKSGNGANCQDFVFRISCFLNTHFKFPDLVKNFLEKMKGSKKIQKEFTMSEKFMKMFKISKKLLLQGKKRLTFINNNTIIFDTHELLDRFFWHCKEINMRYNNVLMVNYYSEYELLKSFDRAFHISKFFAERNSSFEILRSSMEWKERGCAFSQEITKKDLLVEKKFDDEKDLKQTEEKKEPVRDQRSSFFCNVL